MAVPNASAKELFVLGMLSIRPTYGHEIMRALSESRSENQARSRKPGWTSTTTSTVSSRRTSPTAAPVPLRAALQRRRRGLELVGVRAAAVAERPEELEVPLRHGVDDEPEFGQLLTELCEDLADSFDVSVVAGQPNQNPTKAKFRSVGVEVRNRVRIMRVWNSRWPKSRLWGRALNLMSYLLAASLAAVRLPRQDIVVVETDPPLLCLLGAVLKRWWRAKFVVYLQDIYPDVAIALGKIPDGRVARRLRRYGLKGRTVHLKRRLADFRLASASLALTAASALTEPP